MSSRKVPMSSAGFTLLEVIFGIVVLAIALTVITSLLAPLAKKGIDPIYQVRASELGGSLMNELLGKSFDHNSDHNGGGNWRCGETGQTACTLSAVYGPDAGEGDNTSCTSFDRAVFNDVDDYDTGGLFCAISNSLGGSLASDYRNYLYRVDVSSAEHGESAAKRVDLWIQAPDGSTIAFSGYRWNY